jgi:hypothetical protein
MAYIFKFESSDKLVNIVKNHPDVSFYIYNGSAYYNNQTPISGAFTNNVIGAPMGDSGSKPGYISLYEMNVDRDGSLTNALFEAPIDPTSYYRGKNPRIVPFLIKNGTRISFKTVTNKQFNSVDEWGQTVSSSYPLTASISKEFFSSTTPRIIGDLVTASFNGWELATSGSTSHLYTLANTINYYKQWSPHFVVSSSTVGGGRDLLASGSSPGAIDVGLISIPSIFYGSDIKKGSVGLKFYITGTLVGELKDERKNGELIQVGPTGSTGSGSVAGITLYNEGFIILTGSWNLALGLNGGGGGGHKEDYTGSVGDPSWVCFAQSISGTIEATGSSFLMDFKGTSKVPTLTMFAHARRNMLNHSNNPTYQKAGSPTISSTGSLGYFERDTIAIKNIVSSSYNDPTGSFKKTTYISEIGIYDGNKNLLGVAKLATPVKKTEERDLTFKLKLDI